MTPQTVPKQPKRRRWRRVLRRCLLLVVLVAVGVYVTLPWWAPRDYLRRRLTERLTSQLGLGVTIGGLSLDWADGVSIRNVTIASPEGFSPAPMVRIDGITADLSPITYLLTGRLHRLEAHGLHLRAESDEAGRLNVASLAPLLAEPVASRVAVHEASAKFQTSRQEDLLSLAVSELDLQVSASRPMVRLTMSAVLAQDDHPAPIRFRLSEGDGQETVAVATLEFSNLRLDRLPLRHLLPDLPLRRCGGQAEGWAELRIDNQGMITRCNADVSVRGLEIQPLEGPPLPTVEQAGVGLRASVDPIAGRVWVRRLDVRLPGAELVGDGEFTTELMAGRWEAIQRLNLNGRLQPAELAALLTGSGALPAGLEVDGPADVRLASRFDGTHLDVQLSAVGDALALRRRGQTLKPPGRPMSVSLAGRLDRRNWQFAAERAELVWGGNRLSGAALLDDIRHVAPAGTTGQGAWSAVLGRLACSDGHGQWEITDWDAINDLLAAWGCTARLSARGPIGGRWFLDRTGPPRIHLRVEAGPEAGLSVGEAFTQPQATAVVADLAGLIDAEGGALRDLTVDLAIGTGRLTIDRGELRPPTGASSPEAPAVVFRGQFEARALESLVACFPPLRRWGVNAAGAASGNVALWLPPGGVEANLGVVMQPATLTAGRLFAKAPGQRADLEFHLAAGENLPPPHRCRLTAHGRLEGGEFSALVLLGDRDRPAGEATIDVRVDDADRLTENLPLLADALAGARLSGRASVSAAARWEGPTLEGQLRCDAGGIEYVSAGLPRRVKTAKTPLKVELAGQVTRHGEGDFDFRVDQARATGRDHWAHLRGSGTIRGLEVASGDPPDLRWAQAELNLTELRGTVGGKAIAAGGTVTLEDVHWPAEGGLAIGRLRTGGLELRVGENHAWVLADLGTLPQRPTGQFHVLAEYLDDKDLADWIDTVARIGRVEVAPETTEPAPDRDALAADADRGIEAARKALAPLALHGRIGIDHYRAYDAELGRSYLARCLEAQLSIEDARASAALDAAVKGGVISRRYTLDLTEPSPQLGINSEVREVMADESIQPQLTRHFPGNTVYGLFSRAEEVSIPLRQLVVQAKDPSAPVWPVGHAKTVAVDGMLQGRAAPSFVAQVFPGLNLARYRYNRMTAFAEYKPDGLSVNDMVFSGQTYDIYIEGSTDAEHIGRYEIGLILLGTPQSAEWNHTYRQGRIPLLNVKARIEGGRMHDESVTYPYPTQSLFTIFLKNNLFYRLWLASKR